MPGAFGIGQWLSGAVQSVVSNAGYYLTSVGTTILNAASTAVQSFVQVFENSMLGSLYRGFVEWKFDPARAEQLVQSVVVDVCDLIIPFFRRFQTLEDLKAQFVAEIQFYQKLREQKEKANSDAERLEMDRLAAQNPFIRLNIDPFTRGKKLAAIYVSEGNKDLARSVIDGALGEVEDTVPAVRQAGRRGSLEKLRKTLGLE